MPSANKNGRRNRAGSEKWSLTLATFFWPAIIFALGLVAQSVEQRIENPCVGGSIPPRATKNSVNAKRQPMQVGVFAFLDSVVPGSALFSVPMLLLALRAKYQTV
jgi:hypothetical protein